jgi:hypothetical protein
VDILDKVWFCAQARYLKTSLMELTKSSRICHVAENTANEKAKNLASYVSHLLKEDLGRLLFLPRQELRLQQETLEESKRQSE